jgi:hypothetical protein
VTDTPILSGLLVVRRDEVGVLHTSLGIDIQTMGSTPAHELVWPDHCPDNDNARRTRFVLNTLGFLQPGSVCAWKELTVSHDGLDPAVVDLVIPGYADYAQ